MAANPVVQEKLHEEIIQLLPDRKTKINFEEMPYLRAVLRESLRITPVVPITARILGPGLSFAGYNIDRKCWFVALNQFMSMSEKHYKDPQEFRPERWIRGHTLKEDANPFVSLPFGHGPRMCIGKRYAEFEIQTLICKMVRNFKIGWPQEQPPLGYIPGFVNKPDNSVKLTLTER